MSGSKKHRIYVRHSVLVVYEMNSPDLDEVVETFVDPLVYGELDCLWNGDDIRGYGIDRGELPDGVEVIREEIGATSVLRTRIVDEDGDSSDCLNAPENCHSYHRSLK